MLLLLREEQGLGKLFIGVAARFLSVGKKV